MKPIIFFFAILLIPSLVIAIQANSNQNTGLDIQVFPENIIQKSQSVNVNVHVFNLSTGLPLTDVTTSCELNIYNKTGNSILNSIMAFDNNPSNKMFNHTVLSSNFSNLGLYPFIVHCNTSSVGGFHTGDFLVTNTGKAEQPINIGVATVLMIIAALFIFLLMSNFIDGLQHPYLRLFFLIMTMIIVLLAINFAYITSVDNGASEGLQGVLSNLYRVGIYSFVIFMIYVMLYYVIYPILMHFKQYKG